MEFCVTAGKSSSSRDEFAIEQDRRAGDGAGAERQDVHPLAGIGEPAEIALEHLHVGEQMMREIDRLRALQMRVAGNDDVAMPRAEIHERALQVAQAASAIASHSVAQIEPEIERDLVVADARGVQLRAGDRRCAASAPPRCSCGCLPAPILNWNSPRSISAPISRSPATIFSRSSAVISPAFSSAAECAIEPSMSCRQSRQSKLIDSEYCLEQLGGLLLEAAFPHRRSEVLSDESLSCGPCGRGTRT